MAKKINEVLKEVSNTIQSTLPDNLRGKFELDHLIWEFIDDTNCLILTLVQDRLMTKKEIVFTIEKFDECVEIICHYITRTDQIKLAMYWTSILGYLNDKCLDEEQFEACSNIKKFKDLYFITAPKNTNE